MHVSENKNKSKPVDPLKELLDDLDDGRVCDDWLSLVERFELVLSTCSSLFLVSNFSTCQQFTEWKK